MIRNKHATVLPKNRWLRYPYGSQAQFAGFCSASAVRGPSDRFFSSKTKGWYLLRLFPDIQKLRRSPTSKRYFCISFMWHFALFSPLYDIFLRIFSPHSHLCPCKIPLLPLTINLKSRPRISLLVQMMKISLQGSNRREWYQPHW